MCEVLILVEVCLLLFRLLLPQVLVDWRAT
jgi:hypothetical protein